MQAEPTPDHAWLMDLVGDWTSETECLPGPDEPPQVFKGTEAVRSLGGIWLIADGVWYPDGDETADAAWSCLLTVGFDPQKSRYVGSWAGSPMAQLAVYEGEREGDRLALDVTMPHFEDPSKMMHYRDVIEITERDAAGHATERLFCSSMQQDDGSWKEFMRAVYHRV
ncbi:MAG: DUF1579 domain-containing protein [Planctomycetota bacterium]